MAGLPDDTESTLRYRSGDPRQWPDDLDAVVAAAANHTVLLENEHVRVLAVTIAPGEMENLHHHVWPSVIYLTEAEAFVDRDGEGTVLNDTREMDRPLELPLTMWKEPEALHSVENLSASTTLRLFRVELKSVPSDSRPTPE